MAPCWLTPDKTVLNILWPPSMISHSLLHVIPAPPEGFHTKYFSRVSCKYQAFFRQVSHIFTTQGCTLYFQRELSTFPKGSWDKISKGNVKQFSKIPKGYTNGPQQRMIQGHTLGGMDSDTPNT